MAPLPQSGAELRAAHRVLPGRSTCIAPTTSESLLSSRVLPAFDNRRCPRDDFIGSDSRSVVATTLLDDAHLYDTIGPTTVEVKLDL